MVTVRVLKPFPFTTPRKKVVQVEPGQLVDVTNRHVLRRLREQRRAGPVQASAHREPKYVKAPPAFTRALRVGCWIRHSTHYSGGRMHVYQYGLSLALAGAEVWYITTGIPRWRGDYPQPDNLHICIEGKEPYPGDFDIVMTDSKGPLGMRALAYVEEHPGCRFVCLNFETANWVQKFAPSIARNMNKTHLRDGYSKADLLLGNSLPSMKHLMAWMKETPQDRRYDFLPPAINDYGAAQSDDTTLPEHPYAVWSGRNTAYKNAKLAIEAMWKLPFPFDLVTFGEPGSVPPKSDDHRLHRFKNFPDAAKYRLLRHAHMTLAPSLFEGFGMVPGESLLVGTPVIVYDLPVLRWAYGDKLIYVPWNNREAFREKTREVASEPKRDCSKASVWIGETYGLEAMRGRVEKLPWHTVSRKRISACMICYKTPTAVEAIEAVYPHVDQVIVAYGPTAQFPAQEDTTDTRERIHAMPDPDGKLLIRAEAQWRDKMQMRSWCADQIEGNYQLVLDADEIWVGLEHWQDDFATPRWINLWHDLEHWIHGGRWGEKLQQDGSVCRHYRFSWWRQTYRWKRHWAPIDGEGSPLHVYERSKAAAGAEPRTAIYHLGHALPPHLWREKHAFYRTRDNAPDKREKAWLSWNGKAGKTGDGVVSDIRHEIPEIVQRAYRRLRR